MSSLDGMRLPLTILLGALIIGGVIGVVGINMQPKYDDSRLQPITVQAPSSTRPAAPPPLSATPPPLPATQTLLRPPWRRLPPTFPHRRRQPSIRSRRPTMGDTIEAETTEAAMMGATVTETAAAATAVRANSEAGRRPAPTG